MSVTWKTYVTLPGGSRICVRERDASEEFAVENTKRWIRNNLDDPNTAFTIEAVELDPVVKLDAEAFCQIHGCD